jgi:hypothetical protein
MASTSYETSLGKNVAFPQLIEIRPGADEEDSSPWLGPVSRCYLQGCHFVKGQTLPLPKCLGQG